VAWFCVGFDAVDGLKLRAVTGDLMASEGRFEKLLSMLRALSLRE
jgi:hypothetical protein